MLMALVVRACDNAPGSTRRYLAAEWSACAPAWSTCGEEEGGLGTKRGNLFSMYLRERNHINYIHR